MVWTIDNLPFLRLSFFIYKNLLGGLFLASEEIDPNIWPSAHHGISAEITVNICVSTQSLR